MVTSESSTAGFDALPGQVDPVFERPGRVEHRHTRLKRDALGGRREKAHRADRRAVVVLPEQRERIAEGDAKRVDRMALAVDMRRRRHAGKRAAAVGNRERLVRDVQGRDGVRRRLDGRELGHGVAL
jgi:hypothetical protein